MKLARLSANGEPEIFSTVQGEGRFVGRPSVFIRSSLCNLQCNWCDTDYTWNWEGTPFTHERDAEAGYRKYRQEEQILDWSIEQVADRAAGFGCGNFVFTGGEPLLHESDWVSLMKELASRSESPVQFEIETNGTRRPGKAFLDQISHLNVSPKLANSGMKREQRIREEILIELAGTAKADFKFVADTEDDLGEILEIVALAGLPADRVFLMPRGTTVEAIDARSAWVVGQCQAHGFRFSDRLHVRLFGSRRGV